MEVGAETFFWKRFDESDVIRTERQQQTLGGKMDFRARSYDECKDLGAIVYADEESLKSLKEIFLWVYNNTPAICWGSRGNFNNWLREPRGDCDG